jgi:hypothetical protein
VFLLLVPFAISSNYDTSMVDRLLTDRDVLIQDGLSYFNGTTIRDVAAENEGHEVRCIISIENWSKWMLSFPVTYTLYGDFQYGYHEREIFPSHREVVVAVNDKDSITGTSGTIAWELGHKNIHVIVMWSIPYNLNFFRPYFGIGMVHLNTKFTKDMLPYWYRRMYDGEPGTFKRGRGGQSVVYKHQDVFILGHLERDSYQPVLNISVMPWSTKNLAPSIWHQLYLQTVREKEAQPFSAATTMHLSSIGLILLCLFVSYQSHHLAQLKIKLVTIVNSCSNNSLQ